MRFGERDVIVMAGASGLGKSTLAARLFPGVHIISSDAWRGMLLDDETEQTGHDVVFGMVRAHAQARLRVGRPAVIDSTALRARDRRGYIELATENGSRAHLVIIDGDLRDALSGNQRRAEQGGRFVPVDAVKRMYSAHENMVREARAGRVAQEGWASVTIIDRAQAQTSGPALIGAEVPAAVDVIGDVHGCVVELQIALTEAGYESVDGTFIHPEGRVAMFVGDITDRGPQSLAALRLVLGMVRAGSGRIASIGNHDFKLYRLLVLGRDVKLAHGLDRTMRELIENDAEQEATEIVRELFEHAPAYTHLDLDGGLVVTHGALHADMLGKQAVGSRRDAVSSMAMFGQTDGMREDGKPNRVYDWVSSWEGRSETVVFGHDVIGFEPRRMSETANVWGIDTGAAFGGALTIMRFPEREFITVPATSGLAPTHEALLPI